MFAQISCGFSERDGPLMQWDIPIFSERLREHKYHFEVPPLSLSLCLSLSLSLSLSLAAVVCLTSVSGFGREEQLQLQP